MPVRKRKKIKLAEGVHLNMGKKGISSVSMGNGKGHTYNINKDGGRHTISAKGTGYSYQTKRSGSKNKTKSNTSTMKNYSSDDEVVNFQFEIPDRKEQLLEKFGDNIEKCEKELKQYKMPFKMWLGVNVLFLFILPMGLFITIPLTFMLYSKMKSLKEHINNLENLVPIEDEEVKPELDTQFIEKLTKAEPESQSINQLDWANEQIKKRSELLMSTRANIDGKKNKNRKYKVIDKITINATGIYYREANFERIMADGVRHGLFKRGDHEQPLADVRLIPEDNNKHDVDAIGIHVATTNQEYIHVGYVPAHMARDLRKIIAPKRLDDRVFMEDKKILLEPTITYNSTQNGYKQGVRVRLKVLELIK